MREAPPSARDTAARVAAREVSPLDAVERAIDLAGRWQPATNAFSQLHADSALETARRLHEVIERGEAPGPLAGVPVAVKDLFDVEGWETTGCSRAYEGNVARGDAPVVSALRKAGAVLIGKTNQHELACGATNQVSACGPAWNPRDPSRMTGGSSGGSGAAVAAGVVPIALGTDTGGSIRIPSSFCGVFGLKPTFGQLPLEGVMPLSPSLDCPGPMASSAGDLRLAWEVLSGRAVEGGGPPKLAGVLGGYFEDRIRPDVLEAVRAVASALQRMGTEVVDVDGRGIDDAPEVWTELVWAEFAQAHPFLLERLDMLLPPTARAIESGASLGPDRLASVRARAAQIREWFVERLRHVEVLVAPATPFSAPRGDVRRIEVRQGQVLDVNRGAISVMTRPVNLALLPAVSLPAGMDGDGLPLGVQLVGRSGAEDLLVRSAELLEAAEGRFRAQLPAEPPLSDG